ncbi:MAG: SPOR domain-containing protein [Cryomorphaceae bacterium]
MEKEPMNPSLDQYIAELLYDYDCVVVPRLGGFVSNYRPARFDTQKGLAVPPGKDIRFNRNLTKNDGLLASACADAMGWSFEEGNDFVRSEVENYLNRLNDGAKIKLKKIGILYIDGHKNLRFEPDATHNLLKQAWGFETFVLPEPVQRAAASAKEETPAVEAVPEKKAPAREAKVIEMPPRETAPAEMPEREKTGSEHTRSIYRVAAATLLPFIALSVYMGVQTGFKSEGDFTPADLNPFSTGSFDSRQYSPSSSADFTEVQRATERSFPANDGLFAFSFSENRADTTGVWVDLRKIEETVAAGPLKSSKPAKTNFGTYHIISGCFSEAANAQKHVADLKKRGHDASVLDVYKNLHRVRLESFENYNEALNRLSTVRNDGSFPGAWLLKKQTNL